MHRPTLHVFAAVALIVNALTPRILAIPSRETAVQFAQFDSARIDCPQSGQRVRLTRRNFSLPPQRSETDGRIISIQTPLQLKNSAAASADLTGSAAASRNSTLILLLHCRRNT